MTASDERGEVWAWGELFQINVPESLAISDREHAAEFVPRRRTSPEDAARRGDEREAARAWLSVFGPEADPPDAAIISGVSRFAASVGVALDAAAVAIADADGVLWGRADFDGQNGEAWQVVAVAWNEHLVLFITVEAAADPAFAAAMDAVLASFRVLDPVVVPAVSADEDGDF